MFNAFRSFLVAALLCNTGTASTLEFSSAFFTSSETFAAFGARQIKSFTPELRGIWGAHTAVSPDVWSAYSLQGGAQWELADFYTLSATLQHRYNLVSERASSTLFFLGDFRVYPASMVGIFVSLGWYNRFVHLDRGPVLPTFLNSSLSERGFALKLGTSLRLQQIETEFFLATFNEWEVDNLQNPHLGFSLNFKPIASNWQATLTGRYKILLGFGTFDQFSGWFTVQVPFGS